MDILRSAPAMLAMFLALSTFAAAAPATPAGQEADLVIQAGDMDNLGYGWPQGFDVFSGNSTPSHSYPFTPAAGDPPGTDRILLGSGYRGSPPAGQDGYTGHARRPDSMPVPIALRYGTKGIPVKAARLQLFVDDFQAPLLGARYKVTINGQRALFLEDIINSLRQTGPVGKLVSVQLPEEFLWPVRKGDFSLLIDDPDTGAGDGFAIDFVRLLINPRDAAHVGRVTGRVTDKTTGRRLGGVQVTADGLVSAAADIDGSYELTGVPAGLAGVTAKLKGYKPHTLTVDLVSGRSASLDFSLERGGEEPIPESPPAEESESVAVMPSDAPPAAEAGAAVVAWGRDESDSSDVAWHSLYPSPSFSDDPRRLGEPQAKWTASYEFTGDQLCLSIKDLEAPTASEHTLALGYTVTLQGRVFDDGRTTRTFTLYRFKAKPDRSEIGKCVPVQALK
ncbi:MAG: carboxypeptidase regulatory-like domain-containing protein [Elusimicrobia bacterium]|nr:carboxypeptidase regulatory-like domain-containing protein [Elusimicrobiota bacterium]